MIHSLKKTIGKVVADNWTFFRIRSQNGIRIAYSV